MLTVKMIDTETGEETINEYKSVRLEHGCLFMHEEGSDDIEVYQPPEAVPVDAELSRAYYVMNRYGATVATYRFVGEPAHFDKRRKSANADPAYVNM